MRITRTDRAIETVRFEVITGKPAYPACRHQDRATNKSGLPFHPVALRGAENLVAFTYLPVRIRITPQQISARRLCVPQIGMEVDVPVFVGKRRAQPILIALVSREHFGDLYAGLAPG